MATKEFINAKDRANFIVKMRLNIFISILNNFWEIKDSMSKKGILLCKPWSSTTADRGKFGDRFGLGYQGRWLIGFIVPDCDRKDQILS